MTYNTIAVIAGSDTLRVRCSACAATEGFTDPASWAYRHSWDLAATPGWVEKWESALAGGQIADPGASDFVITDGDILSRVQQLGDDPVGGTP